MKKLIESQYIELKEQYHNDIIAREIIAFLNSDGGTIYIGYNNEGYPVGITKSDEILQKISNIVSDQIEPSCIGLVSPNSYLEEDKLIAKINVTKGSKPLYFLKKYGVSPKGCLIRIGSTTRELSVEEIQNRYKQSILNNDFILESTSKSYPLSFNMLKVALASRGYHINDDSFEKSFKLINKNGDYNIMAELLSDRNMIPLILVKFNGKDKTAISLRNDYGQQSLINGYNQLKDRLAAENICKSDTTVRPRTDKYLFDVDCVNEILVNTLIHNDWTISEPLISIFNDRIEFTSHGGLPTGITKDEFFNGVSCPKNPTLMRIMLALGIVEHTGHGIPTVVKKYGKQVFNISDSYINVVIPFDKEVAKQLAPNGTNSGTKNGTKNGTDKQLTKKQQEIIFLLINYPTLTYKEISSKSKIPYRTMSRILNSLKEQGFIERIGNKQKGFWKILK